MVPGTSSPPAPLVSADLPCPCPRPCRERYGRTAPEAEGAAARSPAWPGGEVGEVFLGVKKGETREIYGVDDG